MALSASANPQSLTKAPKVGHILGALPRPQGRRSHHPGRVQRVGDNNPLEARGRFSQICGRGKGHAVLRREYLPHTASVCRVCGTQRGPGIPTTPACYPPAPLLSLTEWHARRRKLPNAPSQQPPGRKRSTHRHIKQHKDALNKAVRTMGTALRAVSNLQQSRTPVCVWGLAVTGPCRGPQGPQLHCAGSHPVRRPSLNLVRGAARSVDRRALRRAACPLAKRRRVRTYNSRAGGNLRPVMRLRR
jgi:hypothetical protein